MAANIQCSRCNKSILHRCHAKGWRDTAMLKVGFEPRWCFVCNKRFYVSSSKLAASRIANRQHENQ